MTGRGADGRLRGEPGPGRPKGSKDRGLRGAARRSAKGTRATAAMTKEADARAAAAGAAPPADLAVKTGSIRAALEEVDQVYAGVYRQAVLDGLRAPPPKSAPYVELVTRYRVGKPPEEGDSARPPLVFLLSHGAPGGYDPLALPPAPAADAPQVVDVAPIPLRPPRSPAPPPRAPAPPPPEDPDELLPLP